VQRQGYICNYEKLLAPFSKKNWLMEQIQLFKGPFCKYASNHYFGSFVANKSQNLLNFATKKVFSFINSSSFKHFKIFQNSLI